MADLLLTCTDIGPLSLVDCRERSIPQSLLWLSIGNICSGDALLRHGAAAEIGPDNVRMLQDVGGPAHRERAAIVEHMDAVVKVGDHLHVVLDPDHGDAEPMLDAQDEARKV